jgi:hypothetical protein
VMSNYHDQMQNYQRRRLFPGYVLKGRFLYDFGDAFSMARDEAMKHQRREVLKRARTDGDVVGGDVAYIFEPGGELLKKDEG